MIEQSTNTPVTSDLPDCPDNERQVQEAEIRSGTVKVIQNYLEQCQ
jgi:hypothetical protein